MNALDAFALAAAGGAAGADLYMAVSVFRRWKRKRKQAADRAVGWWLWNWLSGAPIGTGPSLSDERDLPVVVTFRAGKALTRWLPSTALLAAIYVRTPAPPLPLPELAAVGGGGTLLLAGLTWAAVHAVCEWWHRFLWVKPLETVLRPVLGWAGPARRWLRVPRDKADDPEGVLVALPATWPGRKSEKELLIELTHAKLGLVDVTDHIERKSRNDYLQVRSAKHPPKTAFFREPVVAELVRKAKPSAPLIGLTTGNAPVAVDLDSESPHLLLSAGTGGGKSSMLRTFAAQLIRFGALVIVLDVKRHSQPWLRDLPGVWYFRDVGDVYDALLSLQAEAHRRNQLFDDVPLGEQGPWLPRVLVICEELNATMSKLRLYWRQHRKEPGETQCPAVLALGDLLFMGRAVRLHVAAVAQMATVKDLGGSEQRENYATRILARYTLNAWRMLVPECPYTPSVQHPGRAQVCIGGLAITTQLVHMTAREAHAWASGGERTVVLDRAASRLSLAFSDLGRRPGTVPSVPVLGDAPAALEQPRPELVSVRQASADEGDAVVSLGYEALRKALRRDHGRGAPQPVTRQGQTHLYRPEDLRQWARNRPGGSSE